MVLAGDGRQTRARDARAFMRESRAQSVPREHVRLCATDTSSGNCRGKKTPTGEKVQRLVHLDGGEGGRGVEGTLGPQTPDPTGEGGNWEGEQQGTWAAPEELTPPA